LYRDSDLNTPDAIPGLIKNFDESMTFVYCECAALSDALSDAFVLNDANFASAGIITGNFGSRQRQIDLDRGNISHLEVSAEIWRLNFYANALLARLPAIPFTNSQRDAELRNRGYYNGYLFQGIVRYFGATYLGIAPTEGGAVIHPAGRFVPASALYDSALASLEKALPFATNPADRRSARTLRSRILLFQGEYARAESEALQGLTALDAPFPPLTFPMPSWLYNSILPGFAPDERFYRYAASSRLDSVRLRALSVSLPNGGVRLQQTRFGRNNVETFVTWHENHLILAECAYRRGDLERARTLLNEVRRSYQTSAIAADTLTSVLMETIIRERDIELFALGMRLADQRRFNRWHLPAGTWQYLSIPQAELDNNPNLKP
jgi:tetratricopeptide (TPR) repeat protein